jgi:flagellar biosynthetic protein FliQ
MTAEVDIAAELVRLALFLVLLLSAPILLAGLVVGLVVSLLQAVTQIQEQSLAFIPKIVAMFVAAAVVFPWAGRHLVEFSTQMIAGGLSP